MNTKCLLFPERIVIESLSRESKNLFELSKDTGISIAHLNKILKRLSAQNFINISSENYSVNKECLEELKERTQFEKKMEVEEVLKIMINQVLQTKNEGAVSEQSQFLFKKVWMTKEEEIYFNSMLEKMGDFIQKVSSRKGIEKEITVNQKMIFWGQSTCLDLVNNFLTSL